MTTNEQTIQQFYTAFQNKDYKSMQECYTEQATFSDPVFTHLSATQVRAMWKMFCLNSKDMKITFSKIGADETKGSAEWIATYIFSSTGKKVVNNITARFIFENRKIIKHTDSFSFYAWAKQALGLPGVLLGWTPFLKSKVQKMAMKTLNDFINKNN